MMIVAVFTVNILAENQNCKSDLIKISDDFSKPGWQMLGVQGGLGIKSGDSCPDSGFKWQRVWVSQRGLRIG